jgi:hypothetical protein
VAITARATRKLQDTAQHMPYILKKAINLLMSNVLSLPVSVSTSWCTPHHLGPCFWLCLCRSLSIRTHTHTYTLLLCKETAGEWRRHGAGLRVALISGYEMTSSKPRRTASRQSRLLQASSSVFPLAYLDTRQRSRSEERGVEGQMKAGPISRLDSTRPCCGWYREREGAGWAHVEWL